MIRSCAVLFCAVLYSIASKYDLLIIEAQFFSQRWYPSSYLMLTSFLPSLPSFLLIFLAFFPSWLASLSPLFSILLPFLLYHLWLDSCLPWLPSILSFLLTLTFFLAWFPFLFPFLLATFLASLSPSDSVPIYIYRYDIDICIYT